MTKRRLALENNLTRFDKISRKYKLLLHLVCLLMILYRYDPRTILVLSVSSSSSSSVPFTIRVRLPDGSINKVVISNDHKSLHDTIRESIHDDDNIGEKYEIRIGASNNNHKVITDTSVSLHDLNIKHGTLISLLEKQKRLPEKQHKSVSSSSFANRKHKIIIKKPSFIPYPDLAKDYETVKKQSQKAKQRGTSSFSIMSDISNSFHQVEPQKDGAVKRIYMCERSAERFQQRQSHDNDNRVGLLFGTIQKELINTKKKPKTSLSSTISDDEYCNVAKVQAIYEPPTMTRKEINANNSDNNFDPTLLFQVMKMNHDDDDDNNDDENSASSSSVLRVANWLGIQPIGWIFTYTIPATDSTATGTSTKRLPDDDDNDDDGCLPVFAYDIMTGAKLQIQHMKNYQNNKEPNPICFCTLAMDQLTGSTEAFQLSDVAVQMIFENMFLINDNNCLTVDHNTNKELVNSIKNTNKKKTKKNNQGSKNIRYVATRYPIFVDGKETNVLDTVLCLINTALLSHQVGLYAGTTASSTISRKNGSLTKKIKKLLLQELYQYDPSSLSSNHRLLDMLSDFNLLIAFDSMLSIDESKMLCETIRKYVKGQKQSTILDSKIIQKLILLLQ